MQLNSFLKPNVAILDPGSRTWAESFSDQTAMWTALRDPDRAQALLAETQGDLNASNSSTRWRNVGIPLRR